MFSYLSKALQFLYEPEQEHWMMTAYVNGEVRLCNSKFTGEEPGVADLPYVYRNAVVNTYSNLLVAVVAVQQKTCSSECSVGYCKCLSCCMR